MGEAALAAYVPLEMLLLDLYSALRQLDALTGETTADDILNFIFSTFCIGVNFSSLFGIALIVTHLFLVGTTGSEEVRPGKVICITLVDLYLLLRSMRGLDCYRDGILPYSGPR
jgi:hypothetical protein